MSAPDTAIKSAPLAALQRQSGWLAAGLIIATGCAAYHNCLHTPFVFDDIGAISDNASVRSLWPLRNVLSPPGDGGTVTGRPLLNLTFALNYAAGGLDVRGYHLTNLALHLCASLALFALLTRTLLQSVVPPRFRTHARPVALSIALLWTIHPLNTESVTYVAQRAELLSGLLYLLTLLAFVLSTDSSRPRVWLSVTVAVCLLGMAAKEVMATAPLMVCLYDRTFVAGSFGRALRTRRWFYAALAATWLLLAWLVLHAGLRGGTTAFEWSAMTWHYALTQFDALTIYTRLALWPQPLVFDYGVEEASSLLAVWPQTAAVLTLLALTVVALVRRPLAGFLAAWAFVLLAPSSSFVAVTTQTIAEHRMYLPVAAIVAGAVVVGWFFLGTRVAPVVGICVIAGIVITAARNTDYRSALAIWNDTRAKCPLNPRAQEEYAMALFRNGDIAASLAPYAEAIRLRPDYAAAHHNLAAAFWRLGRLDEAAKHYATAAQLNPTRVESHFMLGAALVTLKRWPEAIVSFEAALRIKPDMIEAHAPLANALMLAGRPADAITHYEAALRATADDLALHNNLGMALLRCARPADAAIQFEAALKLQPDNAQTAANLAAATEALQSRADSHFPRAK